MTYIYFFLNEVNLKLRGYISKTGNISFYYI